jgi:hypothetical protein
MCVTEVQQTKNKKGGGALFLSSLQHKKKYHSPPIFPAKDHNALPNSV